MSRADEHRRRARECRDLAEHMSMDTHRDQLLRMAESWEALANDAEVQFGQPRPTARNDNDGEDSDE